MKTNDLLDLIGEANDEYIHDAKANGGAKIVRFPNWAKWSSAIAACLCIVLLGGMGLSSYFRSYVESHNIELYSDTEYSYTLYSAGSAETEEQNDHTAAAVENTDALSSDEVTEEQAKQIAAANNIHNTLSEQNYEWYGGCCYDFDKARIEIGLTDLSDANKAAVSAVIGNTDVHFVSCDYSYQYLEELYNRIDEKRLLLTVMGVERYSISVDENYVRVYLRSADDNAAICIINEMDTLGGAVSFRTTRYGQDGVSQTAHNSADGQGNSSQEPQNSVCRVVEYTAPESYEAADLYISTANDLTEYDEHMANRYGERYLGRGIRVFTFEGAEGTAPENFNVWYFDWEGTSISLIYFVTRSPKSEDKLLTGWTEAGEFGRAIESLAAETSAEMPMYLVQDGEILYAVIDRTAYYFPDFSALKPEVSVLPAIDVNVVETRVIVFPAGE